MSLYKFIHILLLKNDVQLKQKSDKQPKKIQWPKFILKKSCLKKNHAWTKEEGGGGSGNIQWKAKGKKEKKKEKEEWEQKANI